MNVQNFAFLQDSLKYLGFDGKLVDTEALINHMQEGKKDFQIEAEAFFDESHKLEGTLHFRKSDQSDMYFLNKYEARLKNAEDPEKNREQLFYLNKGQGVTFKEAYNLLQGRSVNKDLTDKEGEKYNAWIQLNFEERDKSGNYYKIRQFNEKYGFDLEKALEKYPIRELVPEVNRALLIRALKRGNLQPVTFEKNGRSEKMYIEANPRYKTLNLYNNGLKRTRREPLRQFPSVGEASAVSEDLPGKTEGPEDPGPAAERKEEEPPDFPVLPPRTRQRIRRV